MLKARQHQAGAAWPRCPLRKATGRRLLQPTQAMLAVAPVDVSTNGKVGGQQINRRLIMMRHADSEEPGGQTRDHDRPITAQGADSARAVAEKLASRGWLPDLIMSSNSLRTRQTLQAMSAAVASFGAAETHLLGSLYTVAALDGQTLKHLQGLVAGAADRGRSAVQCVLCLGHNKGMEEAASDLAGSTVRLETANAALLEGAADSWEAALGEGASWRLVALLTPDA
ncbi:hypothetical protein WJX81_006015 [Elliptochloris bilobata]|uniref:Uncharacterized protein n=1 Tax=Elliptochloris bilobata TaxID=381761 RepID=A0AAW1QUB1_9CHLO